MCRHLNCIIKIIIQKNVNFVSLNYLKSIYASDFFDHTFIKKTLQCIPTTYVFIHYTCTDMPVYHVHCKTCTKIYFKRMTQSLNKQI